MKLCKRLGRRGAYLLLKSAMYTGHGLLFLFLPVTPQLRASLGYILEAAPLKFWGCVWIAAALIAFASAFRKGPHDDRWGFFALISLATLWAVGYATAWMEQSGATFGSGAIGAILYLSLAGVILIVSGWNEPEAYPVKLIVVSPEGDE